MTGRVRGGWSVIPYNLSRMKAYIEIRHREKAVLLMG